MKKKSKQRPLKWSDWAGGLFALFCVGWLFLKIFRNELTLHLLKNNSVYIKAVIVDKKNGTGGTIDRHFSYSYRFVINGCVYENDAHDPSVRIGDSVDVEYVKGWPSFNKALHPTE